MVVLGNGDGLRPAPLKRAADSAADLLGSTHPVRRRRGVGGAYIALTLEPLDRRQGELPVLWRELGELIRKPEPLGSLGRDVGDRQDRAVRRQPRPYRPSGDGR